uniref:Uncharacterized protein n=1 Tax=Anguilla anguilla TaxID=7936 RepID=A0A0E9TQ19_ANGAN
MTRKLSTARTKYSCTAA